MLTFFSRYNRLGASSRYRMFMYADEMNQQAPDSAQVRYFFSDHYLKTLYGKHRKSFGGFLTAMLHRMLSTVILPEKSIIEYELFPFFPAWLELFWLKNHRFILNFDDFVHLKYAKIPFLRHKYQQLMAKADGVICANDELVNMARLYNPNVIKIPTAVRVSDYQTCCCAKFPQFTVVWIGTPVTYKYLLDAADKLRKMAETVDFELLVIAKQSLAARPIPGVKTRYVDWSSQTEADLLRASHVGIMPLSSSDPMAIGKSAFKLIQYMAAGIPAIATDLGENRQVLQDGVTGFLADSPQEWADCLAKLHDSPERLAKMSGAAQNAVKEYSFEYCFQKFTDYVARTFA